MNQLIKAKSDKVVGLLRWLCIFQNGLHQSGAKTNIYKWHSQRCCKSGGAACLERHAQSFVLCRVCFSQFVCFGRLRAGAYGQSIGSCSEMRETTVATLSPFLRWPSQCPVDRKLSFTESGHTPSDGQPFSLHRPFNGWPLRLNWFCQKYPSSWRRSDPSSGETHRWLIALPLFLVAKWSECCKSAQSRLLKTQLSPIKRCLPKKQPSINTMTRPEEPQMRRWKKWRNLRVGGLEGYEEREAKIDE